MSLPDPDPGKRNTAVNIRDQIMEGYKQAALQLGFKFEPENNEMQTVMLNQAKQVCLVLSDIYNNNFESLEPLIETAQDRPQPTREAWKKLVSSLERRLVLWRTTVDVRRGIHNTITRLLNLPLFIYQK